jgi:hypothetical protein
MLCQGLVFIGYFVSDLNPDPSPDFSRRSDIFFAIAGRVCYNGGRGFTPRLRTGS